MKAPDKIYVAIYNTEYISKDALLDWLKAVKADVMIPMNIDRVIAKIESL
ncbi:MAG: hypothetical protein II661_06965 [Bacteroidales bacterium]|nr:hypothetical protein [Bacteroidales bacterium]